MLYKPAIVCNYVIEYLQYLYSVFGDTGVKVIIKMFHSIQKLYCL